MNLTISFVVGAVTGFQIGNIKKMEKFGKFHLPQKHKLVLNRPNTNSMTESSTHGKSFLLHQYLYTLFYLLIYFGLVF